MTEAQKWLSRRFVVYKFFTNMWFIGAVWLYFYRLFITDQQVGVLDGVAFAIGILAEVPSGALADKFGRDKLVRAGQLMIGGGLLIQTIGGSWVPLFVGQVILVTGASFISGADEALFFEKLNFNPEARDWRKLVTRATQFSLIGTVMANTAGGWMHTINPRIPWILTAMAFFIAAAAVWPVKDDRPRAARQKFLPEIKSYLDDIKTGFAQFRLPRLWIYVPLIITLQGIFYTVGWGLLRLVLLDRFDFSPFWGGVTIASSALITVGILAFIRKFADRLSEKRVLLTISLSALASLLLAAANIGHWGYLVILALYAGEHVLQPFMSEVLNNQAPERYRATVLSVASFLRMLPYIVLAPLIGAMNTNGKLPYFLVGWSVLLAAAVFSYLLNKRRDEKINLTTV